MFSFPFLRSVGAVLLLVLGTTLLSACEDGTLTAPDIQDDLFNSYVALGNSITAGFQSGGISGQTQAQSYAAILADSMKTPFGIPELSEPGCPPPFTRFFDANGAPNPQRPGSSTCSLRNPQVPPRVNNVAVPRAAVADLTTNLVGEGARPNPLTQFILGGRTQVEAALDANPTFATIWIGNNNALVPALNGTDNVTPAGDFQEDYAAALDRLTGADTFEGGVLIGVANVAFTPFFSPGPVYFALDRAGQFPDNFDVASSCTTRQNGLTPLVPLNYGFQLIGQALQTSQTVTLDCQAADTPVLNLNEVQTIVGTVRQYNAFIQQQAQQRDMAYLNPNRILRALYTNDDGNRDPTDDLIPKFPDRDSDQPFGRFFSLDGIHPSGVTHRVLAARLTQEINRTYDTNLSPPSNVPSIPSQ